ncbi:hypothetical protein ACIBQ6_11600 [Nonomuraea sp. NPDC049655]|uniref:hypothetical protein n=1 Tax=Nonomuraea sp. NPDC049655 TaxID=3364355 RepID=UPI0037A74B72
MTVGGQRRWCGGWWGGGGGGEEDGAEDGDAGRAADLVDGGQDPARGACVASGDACQDDVDEDGGGEAESEAAGEQREREGPVAGLVAVFDVARRTRPRTSLSTGVTSRTVILSSS